MEKRRLGTSDVQITPILMGTWQAGKKMWVGIEDADSIKAVRAAFKLVLQLSIRQKSMEKGIQNVLSLKLYLMFAIALSMPRRFLPTISSMTK